MFQHGSCRCFFPSMMVFSPKSNRSDGLKRGSPMLSLCISSHQLELIQTNMAESLMRSCRQRLQQLEMNKKMNFFRHDSSHNRRTYYRPRRAVSNMFISNPVFFHLHSPLVWDFWPTGCSHVVGRKYPGAAWWHHWVAHLPREIVPVGLSGRWASQWLGTRLFKKLRQNTKKANQGSNGQHIKQKKSHIFILHIILRTLNLPHFHRGSFSNDFMVSWGAPSDQLLFSTRKTRQTTCGADRCVAQWTARLAPVAAFGVGNHNHPWVICLLVTWS